MKILKTKKEIINNLIKELHLSSINNFADKLGYSNSSGVYNMINENLSKDLGVTFINKILSVFPNVNIDYLKNKSEQILHEIESQSQTELIFNKTPDKDLDLLAKLLKEQVKTNNLLRKILEK